MSLTSRIQALTTYANGVTGESDTTLSDAVATLAEGYGSGGYSLASIASKTEPSGGIGDRCERSPNGSRLRFLSMQRHYFADNKR